MYPVDQNTCPFCGGNNIVRNVMVGQAGDARRLGLTFKTVFIFTGTEPLTADLCRTCGSVVRLSVANPDREWRRVP